MMTQNLILFISKSEAYYQAELSAATCSRNVGTGRKERKAAGCVGPFHQHPNVKTTRAKLGKTNDKTTTVYLSHSRCAAEKAAWAKENSPTPTTLFQNEEDISLRFCVLFSLYWGDEEEEGDGEHCVATK